MELIAMMVIVIAMLVINAIAILTERKTLNLKWYQKGYRDGLQNGLNTGTKEALERLEKSMMDLDFTSAEDVRLNLRKIREDIANGMH